MKKDFYLYYEKPINEVFEAYKLAITQKLGKDCKESPYFMLSFKIGTTVHYNMNGGVCTVRLVPYNNGTAVNVNYKVYQLFGARCEAHNRDLTIPIQSTLDVVAKEILVSPSIFDNAK